jgi:hypothetical protein
VVAVAVAGNFHLADPIKTRPETQAQPMAATARAKVETVLVGAVAVVGNLVVQVG